MYMKIQTFSLMPPTGKTLPLRLSSPVMARSGNYERSLQCVRPGRSVFCENRRYYVPGRIGVFVARERSAVTIVTPALGPS